MAGAVGQFRKPLIDGGRRSMVGEWWSGSSPGTVGGVVNAAVVVVVIMVKVWVGEEGG